MNPGLFVFVERPSHLAIKSTNRIHPRRCMSSGRLSKLLLVTTTCPRCRLRHHGQRCLPRNLGKPRGGPNAMPIKTRWWDAAEATVGQFTTIRRSNPPPGRHIRLRKTTQPRQPHRTPQYDPVPSTFTRYFGAMSFPACRMRLKTKKIKPMKSM
jgi:hypothetical protein